MRTSKYILLILAGFFLLIFQSCSRKTIPDNSKERNVPSVDSTAAIEPLNSANPGNMVNTPSVKKKKSPVVPKVIVVNDKYAHKSVDGRLYYDLEGRRYWRSKKDGKYYLFNKSMINDEAFKKP